MQGLGGDPFELPAPMAVQRLGRGLHALPAGEPRRRYLKARVDEAPRLPLVRVLACAQREAALGAPEARLLFDQFGALCTSGDLDDAFCADLADAAEQLCEFGLLGLLRGERAPEVAPDWVPHHAPRGSLAERGETLGRRKSLGRTAEGDVLDRLLIDPHPEVIRNVLLNPRVNEAMVVRMASRAQASGPILQVIADSRFHQRAQVRRSIASNPNCPPALGCRLLAALTRSELLEIAHDGRIHDEIRSSARTLLGSKPPRVSHA